MSLLMVSCLLFAPASGFCLPGVRADVSVFPTPLSPFSRPPYKTHAKAMPALSPFSRPPSPFSRPPASVFPTPGFHFSDPPSKKNLLEPRGPPMQEPQLQPHQTNSRSEPLWSLEAPRGSPVEGPRCPEYGKTHTVRLLEARRELGLYNTKRVDSWSLEGRCNGSLSEAHKPNIGLLEQRTHS